MDHLRRIDLIYDSPMAESVPPVGRLPLRVWQAALLPVVLLACAMLSMWACDAPVSYYFLNNSTPSLVRELFRVVEIFGNGLGVVIIALTIFTLDPRRRFVLPRLLLASLGAGLAANGVKLFFLRSRPTEQNFRFHDPFVNFHEEWLSFGSQYHSFPSAHTATAVGLAVALALILPRGRWLFAVAPVVVGMQRVGMGSHFASDALVGAVVGWIVALACYQWGPGAEWMHRVEARWREKQLPPPRTAVSAPHIPLRLPADVVRFGTRPHQPS